MKENRVNNSYESDPSSCSTPSSSDNQNHNTSSEGNTSIDKIIPTTVPQLANLFNPSTFKNSSTDAHEDNSNLNRLQNIFKYHLFDLKGIPNLMSQENNKDDISSSQESYFEGFSVEPIPSEGNINCSSCDNSLLKNSTTTTSPSELLIDESANSSPAKKLSNNAAALCIIENSENLQILEENAKQILLNEQNNKLEDLNERSPDLFDGLDDDICCDKIIENNDMDLLNLDDTVNDDCIQIKQNLDYEREILNRVRQCLSGVPPPPSVTISQIDLLNVVTQNKENILGFYKTLKNTEISSCSANSTTTNDHDSNDSNKKFTSLLKPTHTLDEIREMSWPEILNAKHLGIHYNVSFISEKIDLLNLSVIERYIGVETSSSYRTVLSSKVKQQSTRLKLTTQSPGNRLSHLAKRRAVFSSATLQSKSIASRQILINSKKIKTPKRKTPNKSSFLLFSSNNSSANKKQNKINIETKSIATRETSKRALFQSPPIVAAQQPIKPIIKPDIANRVEKSKRALFLAEKDNYENQQPSSSLSSKNLFEYKDDILKRKRIDDSVSSNTSSNFGYSPLRKIRKVDENNFKDLTLSRSLKFKSQSFCNGSEMKTSMISSNNRNKTLFRASSETSCQLSDIHKKKLLWAVSQALQTKHIGVGHPNFKQYATILTRGVKRLFLEFYLNRQNGSTNDTLLKLCKRYVHGAISNMSADDIYLSEKNRIEQEKQTKKLTGYVAPEDYINLRNNINDLQLKRHQSSSLFLSENSCDSFNIFNNSQQSSSFSFASTQNSNDFNFTRCSQDNNVKKGTTTTITSENYPLSGKKLQINDTNCNSNKSASKNDNDLIVNTNLQNSSSKSNLYGIALRENVDCEQRKSAQKQFNGRDMRNMQDNKSPSPYFKQIHSSSSSSEFKLRSGSKNKNNNLSNSKNTMYLSSVTEKNALKAKRQISF